jgi:glycosyltransferase involved in cell wall biosynthesis
VRIAIVTETWWPSIDGVVTRLSATIRHLKRLRHDMLVIAPEGGASEFEGIPVVGVPTVSLQMIYGGKPWGIPLPRVVHYLDRFKPDVVHAVNPFVLGWAAVIGSQRRRYPLVASYHTNIAEYADFYHLGVTKPAIWVALRMLHNRAQVNLATSLKVKRELHENGIRCVEVWRRGVDLDHFHPGHRDPAMRERLTGGHADRVIALSVGRVALEKSLEHLIPLARRKDVHLSIVGDGPARTHYQEQFSGTPTTFVGPLLGEDLARAYASADFFVFPSTHDTLGLVLLEAMASGLPIVAAEAPPTHELVDESGAGVLFLPGEPGSLDHAVDELLRRDAKDMSWRARHEAERWGWQESTEQLIGFYETARRKVRPH